ncbi:Grainyhead-like protein 2 -like protein [Penicillium subrubescens]|uniref:Grainyhead-like protein 2-like protein n=1 Tax=Penicillium subrubescens TaxID=1316194 RepID=A0A1Q5T847_9EURO|nr:Grainyhead-like protein 2 -like protein [Penicillium subrubescens]
MPKPDNDLISRFREKFGDLLLTCDERKRGGGIIDTLHSNPPASRIKGIESLDAMQFDTIKPELTLGLANGSPISWSADAPGLLCPTVVGGKDIPLDRGIPGSGAVFHNGAGDLHSPMIQWEATTAAVLDAPIRHAPTNPWADTSPFVPLSLTRHWPYEDTPYSLGPDYNVEFLTDHDAGYTSLEAPTAMLWHDKERPVTYLNKGQTYTLRVSLSKPPVKSAGSIQYRTFVRVSFEEEGQRSDPAAAWQLWKEGRGLKEAYQRQRELLAVEYVEFLQDSAICQSHPQVRLEKTSVDGFCVIWTADPSTKSYEGVFALKFNFLSTDFTLSKGVKGVPVRLCVKTSVLRPEDRKESTEHDSEICYCAVKLFRDHGAERKLANDEALVKKKVAKLNKQIAEQYQRSGSIGLRHAYNPDGSHQMNSQHRGRKWNVNHDKEESQKCLYAIYLVERTVLDLKEKLAERVRTDPTLIARIIWQNSNGLKILVDDDVVQHIPEGQFITAEVCHMSDTDTVSSSVKSSVMEVKLVF